MSEYKIMLSCVTGVSTDMLVTKMRDTARKLRIDATIESVPASEAQYEIQKHDVDCVLLGPQVKYLEDDLKKAILKTGKNILVDVIDANAYGMMQGDVVLKQAINLIDNANS